MSEVQLWRAHSSRRLVRFPMAGGKVPTIDAFDKLLQHIDQAYMINQFKYRLEELDSVSGVKEIIILDLPKHMIVLGTVKSCSNFFSVIEGHISTCNFFPIFCSKVHG
jgi:hypothetical protein